MNRPPWYEIGKDERIGQMTALGAWVTAVDNFEATITIPWNQAILVVPQRFPLANGNLVAQAVRDGSLGAATSIPTARRGHAQ